MPVASVRSVGGAVSLVARNGRLVHWEAIGYRDLGSRTPLERTDIFRICSMTKPVTSVAVMMLVEAGELTLDEPVSRTLPEFEHAQVYDAGEIVAPRRPVTLEALLLVALVSAVVGVYWQMGSLRAEMLDRFLVVEQRLGEVGERLAALEAKIDIQRAPAQSRNGGP